jgi:hypothetical protein
MSKACMHCAGPIGRRHKSCVMCGPCAEEHFRKRGAASGRLFRAVKAGEIPPARLYACVDCGKPATRYDHRDYSKPLDVQPVCAGCNSRRGPAIWGRPVLDVTRVAA